MSTEDGREGGQGRKDATCRGCSLARGAGHGGGGRRSGYPVRVRVCGVSRGRHKGIATVCIPGGRRKANPPNYPPQEKPRCGLKKETNKHTHTHTTLHDALLSHFVLLLFPLRCTRPSPTHSPALPRASQTPSGFFPLHHHQPPPPPRPPCRPCRASAASPRWPP